MYRLESLLRLSRFGGAHWLSEHRGRSQPGGCGSFGLWRCSGCRGSDSGQSRTLSFAFCVLCGLGRYDNGAEGKAAVDHAPPESEVGNFVDSSEPTWSF